MIPILTLQHTGLCKNASPGFKAFLGLLTVTSLLWAMPAAAADKTPMRVGIETFAEPISFTQTNGEVRGFSVDLIQAIAHEMEFSVQPVVGTWNDILQR